MLSNKKLKVDSRFRGNDRSPLQLVTRHSSLVTIFLLSAFCSLPTFSNAACGSAPTKLFLSTAAGSVTGTHTLVTASGVEAQDAGPKTAKTTSTWFQMQAGVSANTTSTTDSSTANSKGWSNDAGSINAGCSLPSGTFTFSDSMNDGSGSQTNAVLSVHVYKVNAGVFTGQQCGFTNSSVSMSTSAATITASATCPQIDFLASDRLYVEVYYQTGSTNSSSSNTAQTHLNALGTNDFITFPQDITTPGPSCGGSSVITLMGVGCK